MTRAARDGSNDSPPGRAEEAPRICVYARRADGRIRLETREIAAWRSRTDVFLVDSAFCESEDEVLALEVACLAFLDDAKMPADAEGWHRLPVEAVPNLLRTARRRVWTGIDDVAAPIVAAEPLETVAALLAPGRSIAARSEWTEARTALLCFLVGQGLTAKQIAPRLGSTPGAVQRKANRLGIKLSESPQGNVCFRLPLGPVLVVDRAARAAKLTRDGFMRHWTVKATADPARYGMVAV